MDKEKMLVDASQTENEKLVSAGKTLQGALFETEYCGSAYLNLDLVALGRRFIWCFWKFLVLRHRKISLNERISQTAT